MDHNHHVVVEAEGIFVLKMPEILHARESNDSPLWSNARTIFSARCGF